MKKISLALLIIAAAALIISAGCVTVLPAEPKDPLIGTWSAGEYTNAVGMHYLKIYETFYPDNTGSEKGYIDDGSLSEWNYLWIKKDEKKYEAYYSPITFYMSEDGKKGKADTTNTEVNDWVINRVSGSIGIIGEWKSAEKYQFIGQKYDIDIEVFKDGTGVLKFSNEIGNLSYTFNWSEIGENLYVIGLAQTMKFEIKQDGKLYDNFGCVYSRI